MNEPSSNPSIPSAARTALVVVLIFALGVGAWWFTRTPVDDSGAAEASPSPTVDLEVEMPGPVAGPAGAGTDDEPPGSASPAPAPSDTPTEADEDSPVADPGGSPAALTKAAREYLDARENQVSWYHDDDRDWLKEIRPTMTKAGYESLAARVGDGGGSGRSWDVSHERGLAVKVYVECESVPEGTNNDRTRTVLCVLNDEVVDEDGEPIPVNEVPSTWPYVGAQPSATLELRRSGDEWRVHEDYTGLAG